MVCIDSAYIMKSCIGTAFQIHQLPNTTLMSEYCPVENLNVSSVGNMIGLQYYLLYTIVQFNVGTRAVLLMACSCNQTFAKYWSG